MHFYERLSMRIRRGNVRSRSTKIYACLGDIAAAVLVAAALIIVIRRRAAKAV